MKLFLNNQLPVESLRVKHFYDFHVTVTFAGFVILASQYVRSNSFTFGNAIYRTGISTCVL